MSSIVHADTLSTITRPLRQRLFWRASYLSALAYSPLLLLSAYSWFYALLCLTLTLLTSTRLTIRIAHNFSRSLNRHYVELEDSVELLSKPPINPIAQLQRARITARLTNLDLDAFDASVLRFDNTLLCASFSFAVLLAIWHNHLPIDVPHSTALGETVTSSTPDITLHIEPPAYTQLASANFKEQNSQAAEGSLLTWCISGNEQRHIVTSDGTRLAFQEHGVSQTATQSFSWRWQNDNEHGNWFMVEVKPDQAPTISFDKPNESVTTLNEHAKTALLQLNVQDDFAVQTATLHMTLARGNGENVRFTNREWPLPKTPNRQIRTLNRSWSLQDLGMEPGDELYFFVRASDNAPRAQTTQSPTYTIRLPGPIPESIDSSALPSLAKPESLRSQRQIILDTEELIRIAPTLTLAQINERNKVIANDQAALRRRYGEFLGEESSLFSDEHEGESGLDDVLSNFGHAHDGTENATLFDEKTKAILRRALMSMWDAEKHLRVSETKLALPFEYQALETIKELQRAERIYLHRTAFAPPPIKEEARLSGERDGVQSKIWLSKIHQDTTQPDKAAVINALQTGLLPLNWQSQLNSWLISSSLNDETRIKAQQQLREVADGCESCRTVLRAYLRQTIEAPAIRWQAQTTVSERKTP